MGDSRGRADFCLFSPFWRSFVTGRSNELINAAQFWGFHYYYCWIPFSEAKRTTDRPNLVPTLAGSAFYEWWGFSICCSPCRFVVAYYFLVTNSFSLALAVRAFEGLAMSV